jgi:hypothetical protein
MSKKKTEAIDTSKPHQVLVFGDKQYTSEDGMLEFQPTMHGYKLTVLIKEQKETPLAPQERLVTQEIYLDKDGKVTAEFTNAQDWKVMRPVLNPPPRLLV